MGAWFITHTGGDLYLVHEEAAATTLYKAADDDTGDPKYCYFSKCAKRKGGRCDPKDLFDALSDDERIPIDLSQLNQRRISRRGANNNNECYSLSRAFAVAREDLLAELSRAAREDKEDEGPPDDDEQPKDDTWQIDPTTRRLYRTVKEGRRRAKHYLYVPRTRSRSKHGEVQYCWKRSCTSNTCRERMKEGRLVPLTYTQDMRPYSRQGRSRCFWVKDAAIAAAVAEGAPAAPPAPPPTSSNTAAAASMAAAVRPAPPPPPIEQHGAGLARLTLVKLSIDDFERLKPTAARLATASTKKRVAAKDHLRYVGPAHGSGGDVLVLVSRSLRECALHGAWSRRTVRRQREDGAIEQAIALAGGRVALSLTECLSQTR